MPNPDYILRLKSYSKQFYIHHLERQISAFHDLNIDIVRGEFVLLKGANGVGKSTLLRCLYRSYKVTSGFAFFNSVLGEIDLARAADVDIAKLRLEEIGFVTQFLRARPRVSAVQLVAEPLLSHYSYAEALERATEALAWFGLKEELWQAYPSTFSGGEQQKVNLAKALIAPRKLLLLDEPTASLDKNTRHALVKRLAELKKQGVTMIAVFHHTEDVEGLIDRYLDLSSVRQEDEEILADALG